MQNTPRNVLARMKEPLFISTPSAQCGGGAAVWQCGKSSLRVGGLWGVEPRDSSERGGGLVSALGGQGYGTGLFASHALLAQGVSDFRGTLNKAHRVVLLSLSERRALGRVGILPADLGVPPRSSERTRGVSLAEAHRITFAGCRAGCPTRRAGRPPIGISLNKYPGQSPVCQPGGLLDTSRGLSEERAIPPDPASARCTPKAVPERSRVGLQSPPLHHPCRGGAVFPVFRGYRSLTLAQPPASVRQPSGLKYTRELAKNDHPASGVVYKYPQTSFHKSVVAPVNAQTSFHKSVVAPVNARTSFHKSVVPRRGIPLLCSKHGDIRDYADIRDRQIIGVVCPLALCPCPSGPLALSSELLMTHAVSQRNRINPNAAIGGPKARFYTSLGQRPR